MSRNPWGLYYSLENRVLSLPLLHVKAVAILKELAAQVKITQTYSNDTDAALEAIYSFPIPARAAVCSFFMIKQDETRVIGHVQEKGEAREIYESAVTQGKQAALMEQQTPDVFRISVGNIQPQEKVHIELIYATELAEDEENDSVRFHLPVHIGARYGQPPDATVEQTGSAFLEIFVDVEAVAPIAKIGCPSHTVSTELGPNPALLNAKELPFSNYARVSLSSELALDKDFVLTVKSAGLDAPRCVAELHPIHNTTALTLTFVPRFQLPDVSRQEFVFLIDRSGSMKGPRIAAAKKALVVMLRSLPAKGTSFQIASFGSRCTSLWNDRSRAYNQATLEDATQHVDGMNADYGGTEIRNALRRCFETRKTDRPTSVFVLTDGAAWDVDGVLTKVKGAVARAPAQAYLRVFVLGIGNSASTAMCEGIARVGNGTCMMVSEQETTFTGKIARMLKAARTPSITNIAADWGVSAVEEDEDDAFVIVSDNERDENETKKKGKEKEKEKVALETFNETGSHTTRSRVQQSPFKIRTLSPGNRLNVYAILQGKTIPKAVTLTGLTEDGSELKLSVPVTLSNLPNAPDSPPAIHALAARKIIQDIEDGQHAITTSIPDDADLLARTVKAFIVRLAKTYSISSSQTSFVAVDESEHTLRPAAQAVVVHQNARAAQIEAKRAKLGQMRASRQMRSLRVTGSEAIMSLSRLEVDDRQARIEVIQSELSRKRGQLQESTSIQQSRDTSPTAVADAPGAIDDWLMSSRLSADDAGFGPSSVSAASPPDLQAKIEAIQSQVLAERMQFQHSRRSRSTSPTTRSAFHSLSYFESPSQLSVENVGLRSLGSAPVSDSTSHSESISKRVSVPSPPMDPLEAVARLQSFDGCFAQGVLSIVQLNISLDEARAALGVPEEVFATIIAMAFLCTKLGPEVERDSWEAIYDKARAYVEDALKDVGKMVGVDKLQAQAIGYLAGS
ncbi:hypothetical protein MVEN_01673000 [Mycena venus]|uniref:Uncharacterized protein n=1 Tax=Mycena venus TaxID=2733690 RepID=A0A8H6XRE8_9AGAR|nr:hypothetical protein MVEN_01673000 [Mycena venus]